MRQFVRVMCSAALVAIVVLPTAVLAQQKTAKECDAEWTANKVAIQASGKTKKQFVTECRATAVTPAPDKTAPAATATVPTKPATATPAAATAPAKPATATPSATVAAPAKLAPAAPAAPASTGKPLGNAQFATEAAAKGHCPSDTVVWVNSSSNVYHFSGTKDYGTTKAGAYMCEKDTAAAGARAAKNEKHP